MEYNNNSSAHTGMTFDDLNSNYDYDATKWNDTDTSQFLFDSPQPEPRSLQPDKDSAPKPQASGPSQVAAVSNQGTSNGLGQNQQQPSSGHYNAPNNTVFTMPSSASESSDHSSSSQSSVQRKRKSSRSSTPPDFVTQDAFPEDEPLSCNTFQDSKMFDGSSNGYNLYNNMSDFSFTGQDLNTFSLQGVNSMDFSSNNSPEFANSSLQGQGDVMRDSNYSSMFQANQAPAMPTIQPSQTTFQVDHSRDSSPMMFGSHQSSPGAFANTSSPFGNSNDMYGTTFSNSPRTLPNRSVKQENTTHFDFDPTPSGPAMAPAASAKSQQGPSMRDQWPCQLEVAAIPEKSRVETQIPIELKMHNVPKGITKVHLPAHTISKPKFQSKTPYERSPDTLELSAMLVCASAMEKGDLEEGAFQRAAKDDIFVPQEENQPAAAKVQTEDPDPNKPLNGGPVSICSGCINRERKRAARKKTKKQEEEDDWAQDEAKRVIVFNTQEVRDWCVDGSKDIPLKDQAGQVQTAIVKAPMRIACYCRHQNEKIGFQVLFTLRTANNDIVGQVMSQSIMITDDHKQPGNGQPSFPYPMMGPSGPIFAHGMPMSYLRQPAIHRNSYSSSDLATFMTQANFGNHYAPQRGPPGLSRQSSSGYGTTLPSTASTTPRNLSRPASPTSDIAPSAKKRRGGSGHHKVPSGLTMTRMENNLSPTSAPQHSSPPSAGLQNNGFGLAPHGFGRIGNSQSPSSTDPYSSGPTTPLYGPGGLNMSSAFAPPSSADYQFYSAPTSQQPSRAPSPSSAARQARHQQQKSQHANHPDQQFMAGIPEQQQSVPPQALSTALSQLDQFDPQQPPMIQKMIPHYGHIRGGEEITILGQGFTNGLQVCFGDQIAPIESMHYWGPSSLVLRAPPAQEEGQVAVVFRHQHSKFSKNDFKDLVRMQGVMPTTQVLYTYLDDDRTQMQQLEAAVRRQELGR